MVIKGLDDKSITVYCSSSSAVAPIYFKMAVELGKLMAKANATLVYGGTRVGLMGAISQAVRKSGGRVIGIIPTSIHNMGIVEEQVDELVITDGMRERKALMEDRADAFIALPGGFGTLEEFFEILTAKQLGLHHKAIVLLNVDGYYNELLRLINTGVDQEFIKENALQLFHVATSAVDALEYIASYQMPNYTSKWFDLPEEVIAGKQIVEKETDGEVPGIE